MNDPQLLQDSRTAARHMAVPWIRSVFRELSYQLWKTQWKVEHVDEQQDAAGDNNTVTTTCRLHLTTELLQQSQLQCQQLASRWCHRLTAMGHYDVAEWIQQVLREGPAVFFTPQDDNAQVSTDTTTVGTTTTTTTSPSVELDGDSDVIELHSSVHGPHDETQPAATSTDTTTPANAAAATTTHTTGTPSPSTDQNACLLLTTLRQMCLPRVTVMTEDDHRAMIAQLDRMGHNGQTLWPYDWNVIQRAAQKIPMRCHNKANINSTRPTTAGFQLQLVPKSLQQQQQQQEHDSNATTTIASIPDPNRGTNGVHDDDDDDDGISISILSKRMETQILKKKRKRHSGQGDNGKAHSQHKVARTKDYEHVHDVPRPAATVGEWKESWSDIRNELFSSCHKELTAYLHPDDNNADEPPCPNILLGALKPVGQVHYSIQAPWDDPEYSSASRTLTASTTTNHRLQRRRLRKSLKERLGPHQEEKDVKDPRDRWSHILRTASTTANDFFHSGSATTSGSDSLSTNSRKQYWWDLDLGECLLELEEDNEDKDDGDPSRVPSRPKRRTLCAFSSLEIMLLDEDEDASDAERGHEESQSTTMVNST